jgi:hypothetical protein
MSGGSAAPAEQDRHQRHHERHLAEARSGAPAGSYKPREYSRRGEGE